MSDRDDLERVFCRIGRVAVMRTFFQEIFTKAERKDLSLRWKLMQMLAKGVPQRKISAELGVSLCKITRGAKVLKIPGSVSRSILAGKKTGRKRA